MTPKEFARKILPPAVVTALKRLRPTQEVWTPQQQLRASHESRNEGLPGNEIAIRDGIVLKVTPDSREAFEHFCFRSPEMVDEMDSFLANVGDRQRFLDVGALHGIFSLVFTANHLDRRAVAVDASPLAFSRLLLNTYANGLEERILNVEAALSDRVGTLDMHFEWQHAVAGEPLGGETKTLAVEMTTGDELCSGLDFKPDVVKVDVEGHEVQVLRGLVQTLERRRPLVFLEVHPIRITANGSSLSDLTELLTNLNYVAETSTGDFVDLDVLMSAESDVRLLLRPSP